MRVVKKFCGFAKRVAYGLSYRPILSRNPTKHLLGDTNNGQE